MTPDQPGRVSEDRKQITTHVEYTSDPWSILESSSESDWIIVGDSSQRGRCEIARIPAAAAVDEFRANARLIVQAPAMHRAAVKLMSVWGTEDAQEAMAELAAILSRAVQT